MGPNFQDWRSLAEQASTEMDPEKLLTLVSELCEALEMRRNTPRFLRPEANPAGSSARQGF